MKFEPVNACTIYCPKCGRKVGTYDGKSKINKSIMCKNCTLLVVYDVTAGQATTKPMPKRTQSSGKRFY